MRKATLTKYITFEMKHRMMNNKKNPGDRRKKYLPSSTVFPGKMQGRKDKLS
jgi:hypothetical protein